MSRTFGARYLASQSAAQRLALEEAEERRTAFAAVDAVVDRLVLSALHGERVVELVASDEQPQVATGSAAGRGRLAAWSRSRPNREPRLKTTSEEGNVMAGHFAVARQQQRGAWYLPESRAIDVGTIHLAYWWRTSSRYTLTLADEERRVTADLEDPGVLLIWAVLEPLFADLALPVHLRCGKRAGQTPPERSAAYWKDTITPVYAALGAGADALSQFAPATGWDALGAEGVIARRDALIGSWTHANLQSAARLRTYRIGKLVERYYAKGKNGQALRKRVMNDKTAERVLSAYFAGDWLAFLEYLGEEPHADEEVTAALPKPTLLVTSSARAKSVAAAHGVPAEEVERMLAAYWNQSITSAPVERRVSALKRLWREFDEQEAERAPGVPEPSYRLVSGQGRYRYSEELLDELRTLWGTKLLPRSPERLVTAGGDPRSAFRTFGPAIQFFQAVSGAAWNRTEGGDAHHGLADLEDGIRKATDALASTGHPADPAMFAELRAAKSRLGPVEEIPEQTEEIQRRMKAHPRLITDPMRTRRDGFEILRDIITSYRRAWAQAHLDAYLHDRWKSALQAAGEAYHRYTADRGKPPTTKQFAAEAAAAANDWFGGDLTGVYRALGIKSKLAAPVYGPLLARRKRGEFNRRAVEELEAVAVPTGASRREQTRRTMQLGGLRSQIFKWVERYEALGRPPTLSEFDSGPFKNHCGMLSEDVNEAWQKYEAALERALASSREAGSQAAGDT